MSVAVLVDTGAVICIGISSLHLDDSQLIYLAMGYHSSFSDRRHKIHPLSYFLVFFVPAVCHVHCFKFFTMDIVLFQLCTMYTVLSSSPRILFCFSSAPCILLLLFLLQFCHDIYCEAIWMSSGRMVIFSVCRDDAVSISSVFSFCFFTKNQYIIILFFPFLPPSSSSSSLYFSSKFELYSPNIGMVINNLLFCYQPLVWSWHL